MELKNGLMRAPSRPTDGKPCNVGPILHLGNSRGETCGTLSRKPILVTQFGVRQHTLTDPAVCNGSQDG